MLRADDRLGRGALEALEVVTGGVGLALQFDHAFDEVNPSRDRRRARGAWS